MGRFPWDSHRNDIPVDKPDNLRILSSVFLIEIFDLLGRVEIPEKLLLNHYRKSVQNSEVARHVWVELKL